MFCEGTEALYEASVDPDATTRVGDDVVSDVRRRKTWALITQSLDSKMIRNTASVKRGEVELLIRSIRNQFYRATVANRSYLRNKLDSCSLEDHEDVEVYIAFVNNLCNRLTGMGKAIDDEEKQHFFMKGLPDSDFGVTKTAVSTTQTQTGTLMSWEAIISLVRGRAAETKHAAAATKGPKQVFFQGERKAKQSH